MTVDRRRPLVSADKIDGSMSEINYFRTVDPRLRLWSGKAVVNYFKEIYCLILTSNHV